MQAETGLQAIDLANFWGAGQPLLGVRVSAKSNFKTEIFATAALTDSARAGSARAGAAGAGGTGAPPSFCADIWPLVRSKDLIRMTGGADWLSYESTVANAAHILDALQSGALPEDGPWPAADIELFKRWVASGMPR